ncbi:MAG: hypothetical protein DRN68_00565 [Thaumarchaeota archaeon]|nr:MAG: hypothetical protein DRN68_00565 [Nitrososphaerota archaeon]
MARVVVVKGGEIKERTLKALSILSPRLPKAGSRILIKPNLVLPSSNDSGAITRREVIEGIIEFLGDDRYEIFVGEGAAIHDTWRCFREAKYDELEKKYRVKLVDLNRDEFREVRGKYWKFKVSKLFLDSDYIVSAAVLKEHAFKVTLTLKNMMGVLKPGRFTPTKSYMHREYDFGIPSGKTKWARRLCDLIMIKRPDLALIDATTAMFGSHINGRLKRFDMVIVSEDPVACDIIGAKLLGHEDIFYLEMMLDERLGEAPSRVDRIEV